MLLNIDFLGKTLKPYGLLCTLGLIVAVAVAYILAHKKGLEIFDFTLVVIFTLIGALIGAKGLFLIVSWKDVCFIFQNYPLKEAIAAVIEGGFVFYGGLIGGIVAFLITMKIKKVNILDYATIFVLVLPLGHAFGRVGCFVAGCCYGVEYHGLFSHTYSSATDASTPLGVPLLPVQLIEAISLFVLFGIMLLVYLLPKHSNKVCYIYLLGYSILRFVLEFFRGDLERGLLFNLSTSQWVSIGIVVITIAYIAIVKCRRKQCKKE